MNAFDDLKIIFKGHQQLEELCSSKRFDEAGAYLLAPEHHLIKGIIVHSSDTAQQGIAVHEFMQLGIHYSTLIWDIHHIVGIEYDCFVPQYPAFTKAYTHIAYIVQNGIASKHQYRARFDSFKFASFLQVRIENGLDIEDLSVKDEERSRSCWFCYTCTDENSLIVLLERGYFDPLSKNELGEAAEVVFGRGYLTLHQMLVKQIGLTEPAVADAFTNT